MRWSASCFANHAARPWSEVARLVHAVSVYVSAEKICIECMGHASEVSGPAQAEGNGRVCVQRPYAQQWRALCNTSVSFDHQSFVTALSLVRPSLHGVDCILAGDGGQCGSPLAVAASASFWRSSSTSVSFRVDSLLRRASRSAHLWLSSSLASVSCCSLQPSPSLATHPSFYSATKHAHCDGERRSLCVLNKTSVQSVSS